MYLRSVCGVHGDQLHVNLTCARVHVTTGAGGSNAEYRRTGTWFVFAVCRQRHPQDGGTGATPQARRPW